MILRNWDALRRAVDERVSAPSSATMLSQRDDHGASNHSRVALYLPIRPFAIVMAVGRRCNHG